MKLTLRRRPAAPPRTLTRVYTREGRRAHIMLDGRLLCPTSPGEAGWKGLSPAEAGHAATLPTCSYCRDALAALGGPP